MQLSGANLPLRSVALQRRTATPCGAGSPTAYSHRRAHLSVARIAAPQQELTSLRTSQLQDDERPQTLPDEAEPSSSSSSPLDQAAAERRTRRQREQLTYQASAIAASVGITGLSILATYLRFAWHTEADGTLPWDELLGTLALVAGGAIGMEMYARFAHKTLWHEFEPGWTLHRTHHLPRTGPFEDNDIFAVINGVPAMVLCAYGFLTPGLWGGACFGAGLGITLFGIAYMFIHDGLVHRRFPVGPIAEWPYLKRLTVAHQLHHANKYEGAPWGMFLGPQELEAIPGATEELERLVQELDWSKR